MSLRVVVYCKRDTLGPQFGRAVPPNTAMVRGDLPRCVRKFVEAHELYHLQDTAKWWVWRELKANSHAAVRHPAGAVGCVFMSLATYRLKYYWKRIVTNDR